jgi:Sulfotransferase domain
MTLQVIGAGFGRTGTLSTYTALNKLGFPCYHMLEVIENKSNQGHLDFWRAVAHAPAGTKHDWARIFAKYTAAVDNPACCVWRELREAYPEAKVLLTLHPRGAEAWYESTIDTIYFTENRWQFKLLRHFAPFIRKMGDMSHELIWQRNHRGTMNDRARALAHYQTHIEEVRAAVPPDKLLIFKASEGWEPLCRFLGVPVPNEPFPNVNDRAEIKKLIAGMAVGAYVIIAFGVALALGLVYAGLRLFG